MAIKGTLKEVVGRIRRELNDQALGPLIVADDIVALAKNWEDYRFQAGGLECSTFLTNMLGRTYTLHYFEKRSQAIDDLGPASRKLLHHNAAVWVVGATKHEDRPTVMDAIKRFVAEHNAGNPLTLTMAIRITRSVIGRAGVRKRKCASCERLRDKLKANGIRP